MANNEKDLAYFSKGFEADLLEQVYTNQIASKRRSLTETVELGVFVPYPDEGREARDQRRPSVLGKDAGEIILTTGVVRISLS